MNFVYRCTVYRCTEYKVLLFIIQSVFKRSTMRRLDSFDTFKLNIDKSDAGAILTDRIILVNPDANKVEVEAYIRKEQLKKEQSRVLGNRILDMS